MRLIVDEWANDLDDIRAFVRAEATDMINVKSPDLGAVAGDAVAVSPHLVLQARAHAAPLLGEARAQDDGGADAGTAAARDVGVVQEQAVRGQQVVVEQAHLIQQLGRRAAGSVEYLRDLLAALRQMVARLRALLRRSQAQGANDGGHVIEAGELSIDFLKRKVEYAGKPVKLTPTEFQLLQQLALNVGKVLSHTELLTKVWGPEYRDDRDYLWAYVRHLRRKLEPDPERPRHILSEPGYGYVLDCPATSNEL